MTTFRLAMCRNRVGRRKLQVAKSADRTIASLTAGTSAECTTFTEADMARSAILSPPPCSFPGCPGRVRWSFTDEARRQTFYFCDYHHSRTSLHHAPPPTCDKNARA